MELFPQLSISLTPSLAPSSVGMSTMLRALQSRSDAGVLSGTHAQLGSIGGSSRQ
jgi:hypothetical protein